jgi:hypothetical protein
MSFFAPTSLPKERRLLDDGWMPRRGDLVRVVSGPERDTEGTVVWCKRSKFQAPKPDGAHAATWGFRVQIKPAFGPAVIVNASDCRVYE